MTLKSFFKWMGGTAAAVAAIALVAPASIAKTGDVNGDGVVSGADVTALYNNLLEGEAVAGEADVNGDGVVSGADVTALYEILLNGGQEEDNPYVDDSVEANHIIVTWDNDTATVKAPSAIIDSLAITVNGANVKIEQAAGVVDEYTYVLSGTSSDGSFYQDGEYKITVQLNGLNLTSVDSAAVNIQDGKRIAVELVEGTENFLADTKGGIAKAAMMVNGHAEFKGAGALTLTGGSKHAFWGDEYVELKKTVGTITIAGAKKDGFSVNQYFDMKGGTVVIDNVGDDAIQVDATDDTTDEYNGQVFIKGGSLTANVTVATAKGVKAASHMTISGGTVHITNSGEAEFDTKKLDAKGSSCLSSDSTITISGGDITLIATGIGGKGISADDNITISGGTLNVSTSGAVFEYTADDGTFYDTKPHAIKGDTDVTIAGGEVTLTTTGGTGAHGISTKGNIAVTDGTLVATVTDKGLSADGNITIGGGNITITSNGTAAKAIKGDGGVNITAGNVNVTVTGGGEWDSEEMKTQAPSCIGTDADVTIDGGTLVLNATGPGGKGISCDGTFTGNNGSVTISTEGNSVVYTGGRLYNGNYTGNLDQINSDYKSSAKGIKADTKLIINGGSYNVSSASSEGIESKGELFINGGEIECETYDDCINSSSHMTISGGKVYVNATNNDALDANGNLYIKGGLIVAQGGSGAECGIDANDEDGYHLYVTGGTFVGIGGTNISRPYSTTGVQPVLVYSGSVSANTTLTLNDNSGNNILAFTLTRSYTGGGGWAPALAPPGGGGPGGGSLSLLISSPNIKTGSAYTLYSGQTASGEAWHGLIAPATVSGTGTKLGSVSSVTTPYSTISGSSGGGWW